MTDRKTVEEFHPNDLIGHPSGSPSNDNKILQPFIDSGEAENALAAIYGVGYGDRGYGQTGVDENENIIAKLQHVSSGEIIGEVTSVKRNVWIDIHDAVEQCYLHQIPSTKRPNDEDFIPGEGINSFLPPRESITAGNIIRSFGVIDGDASREFNFRLAIESIDKNRFEFFADEMSLVKNIHNDKKSTSWGQRNNESISTEFRVSFDDENHARYFFNTGGSIIIRLSHLEEDELSVIRPQDTEWHNGFMNNVGMIIFNRNETNATGNKGETRDIGYYDLKNTYETIYDVENITDSTSSEVVTELSEDEIKLYAMIQANNIAANLSLYGVKASNRTVRRIDTRNHFVSRMYETIGLFAKNEYIQGVARTDFGYYGIFQDGHIVSIDITDLSKSVVSERSIDVPGFSFDKNFLTITASLDGSLYTFVNSPTRIHLIRINVDDPSNSVLVGSSYFEIDSVGTFGYSYMRESRPFLVSSVFHDGTMYAIVRTQSFNSDEEYVYRLHSVDLDTGQFSLIGETSPNYYVSDMESFRDKVYCSVLVDQSDGDKWNLYTLDVTNATMSPAGRSGGEFFIGSYLFSMFSGTGVLDPLDLTNIPSSLRRFIFLTNNVKVEARRSNYKGENGGNGSSVDFRVTITDTESPDEISSGTTLNVDYVYCVGDDSKISVSAPDISEISDNTFDNSDMPEERVLANDHRFNQVLYGIRSKQEDIRLINLNDKTTSFKGTLSTLELDKEIQAATTIDVTYEVTEDEETVNSESIGVTENGKVILINFDSPKDSLVGAISDVDNIKTALSDGEFLYIFDHESGDYLSLKKMSIKVDTTNEVIITDERKVDTNLNKNWNPTASFYHDGNAYVYIGKSLYVSRNLSEEEPVFVFLRRLHLSHGETISGMANVDGVIYGATDNDAEGNSYLYTIDPANGLPTLVGNGSFSIGSDIHALFAGRSTD